MSYDPLVFKSNSLQIYRACSGYFLKEAVIYLFNSIASSSVEDI